MALRPDCARLGGNPQVADPERLTTVLDSVNALIQYIIDFPQEQ